MTTNLERELKLQAPKGFSLARLPRDLKAYVASPAQFKRLHTIYYDTADLRLMRWGCSLRYRGDEGWTLKLPVLTSDKALSREEHVFSGDPQHVPDEAIDLATVYLRGKPVMRVAELRTVRTKREVRDGHGERLAEVVEDDVRVVDGTHVEKRFHQIEIELQDGVSEDALDAIADVLRTEGAGPPDATPKGVAAITDLLYGFEPRSTADFLHKYSDLRVGADIVSADGSRCVFRRRKGLRNTLVDAADKPLDDALLDPLLGGVTREVFRTAFGLSQDGLRAGAQALIEARGGIGESLFAASSGLKGLVGGRGATAAFTKLAMAARPGSRF